MYPTSKLTASSWSNGQPTIDIYPYDYTPEGFEFILDRLAMHFTFPRPTVEPLGPEAIPELWNYLVEVRIQNEVVSISMDEYTCSIATQSIQLRDKILQDLNSFSTES